MDIRFSTEESRATSLDEIKNSVSGNSEDEKVIALHAQALDLKDDLLAFAHRLDEAIGSRSEVNVKRLETILAKSQRPSIRERKPWFRAEHVRDCLRFRSRIENVRQIFDVMRFFEAAADNDDIAVVKIDFEKFFRPAAFGWRMIALDIRLRPEDFLCEYYVTYGDLISINDRMLHRLFEDWRG